MSLYGNYVMIIMVRVYVKVHDYLIQNSQMMEFSISVWLLVSFEIPSDKCKGNRGVSAILKRKVTKLRRQQHF